MLKVRVFCLTLDESAYYIPITPTTTVVTKVTRGNVLSYLVKLAVNKAATCMQGMKFQKLTKILHCIYWLNINVLLIYKQIHKQIVCLRSVCVLQFLDRNVIGQCNETIFHMSCRCIDAYYSFKTLYTKLIQQKIQLKQIVIKLCCSHLGQQTQEIHKMFCIRIQKNNISDLQKVY